MHKSLLQKKIALQKIRNIISRLNGIFVFSIEESDNMVAESQLHNIGYYSSTKNPDSAIPQKSPDKEIIDWIIKEMNFIEQPVYYLWLNSFFVKIKILDISKAVYDLWNCLNPDCKGFVLINEEKTVLYEFGNDSRDEYNYLFDKYYLDEVMQSGNIEYLR